MMSGTDRWTFCVQHRGAEANDFISNFFSDEDRRILVITAGGFDPRSCMVPERVVAAAGKRAVGIVFREERPEATEALEALANEHTDSLVSSFEGHEISRIPVFADDGAVVGGRHAVSFLSGHDFSKFTDIVVDFSALSIGIAFPIVKYLLATIDSQASTVIQNLHLTVVDEPWTDSEIESIASNRPGPIHGFSGNWGIDDSRDAAKLWIPQLGWGQNMHAVLELLHQFVSPHAVCPILPFPGSNIRFGDELIWRFHSEFENVWRIDDRDIVYAHENQPLDLYRSVLKIHGVRDRVFREVGGSMTILSPTGRKMLAIGSMLAAIEYGFPVMYVESVGYHIDLDRLNACRNGKEGILTHLWLAGEAYPQSKEA